MLPSQLLTENNINPSGIATEPGFNRFGSCESSSSGLSTPFGSTETESNEDDFIGELTRQMAEYMLQEDDEKSNPPQHEGLTENQIQSIQFYQMKNQHLVKHQGSVCWGSTGKMTESTQQIKPKQQYVEKNKGRACGFGNSGMVRPQQAGSGMRVIFLGGSGSGNGSTGTGVFLPPGTGNPLKSRKKPRCSTALIPVRVIEALQLHYNHMHAISLSNGCRASNGNQQRHDTKIGQSNGMDAKQKKHWRSQTLTQPVINNREMCLPQDWTY